MTVFGVDISNWQDGLDLHQVKSEGFDFVICKVTEGAGYRDHTWPGFRDAARDAGLLLGAYHYVKAEDGADAQAQAFIDYLGDTSVPVMLDHENMSGGIDVYWNVVRALNTRGVEVALTYLPRWYWKGHIGSPDLSEVPGLVSSAYVGGTGYASDLYPGPGWNGWTPYGGGTPVLCQFTDRALVAGQHIDCMAFEGDRDALQHLFAGQQPGADTEGDDMAFTEEDRRMLQEVRQALCQPRRSLVQGSDAELRMPDFVQFTDAATYNTAQDVASLRETMERYIADGGAQ